MSGTAPTRVVAAATVDRIVEAAARLWCRDQDFPTVRAIARLAGCSPSTVVGATEAGTSLALRDLVVDRALSDLAAVLVAADAVACDAGSITTAVVNHALDLVAVDPVLAHLPAIALATDASRVSGLLAADVDLAIAAHAVGAMAHFRSAELLEVAARILDLTEPAPTYNPMWRG